MTDHTRWHEINAKLGVAASLVDNQLLDNEPLPLALGAGNGTDPSVGNCHLVVGTCA